MSKIDEFIDRLLPDAAKKRDKRAAVTAQVVEESRKAREHSRAAVVDAYRAAGNAYGRRD